MLERCPARLELSVQQTLEGARAWWCDSVLVTTVLSLLGENSPVLLGLCWGKSHPKLSAEGQMPSQAFKAV